MERHDWDIFERYRAGEVTPTEAEQLRQWVTSHPDGVVMTAIASALDPTTDAPPAPDATAAYARWREQHERMAKPVEANPKTTIGRITHSSRGPLASPRISRWVAYGALAGSLAAGIVAYAWTHTSPSVAPRVYATTTGQRARITLADGSHVTLAPESRLVVAGNFGPSQRTMTLDGEAYFDVTHASGAPFSVSTGAITTRVLGTTFDIRSYARDSAVHIAVVSGKLAIHTPHLSRTLLAGTRGAFTDSTATTTTEDVSRYGDWTTGRLVFDGVPVPVVLTTLGRWYGYTFRLTDSSLTHESIKAEFRTDAPTETMVMLRRVLDVTMTFDGATVVLRPRRLAPATHDRAPSTRHTIRPLLSRPVEAGK